jgi:hypothetical protein
VALGRNNMLFHDAAERAGPQFLLLCLHHRLHGTNVFLVEFPDGVQ